MSNLILFCKRAALAYGHGAHPFSNGLGFSTNPVIQLVTSMRACTVSMLEPRQFGFLGGFYVFFGQLTDESSLAHAEVHDVLIADAAAHVPHQFEAVVADGVSLLIQLCEIGFDVMVV